METKQHAIKNQWINEEIKDIKKYFETNDKTQPLKIYGMLQKCAQREFHSNIGLPQKRRKISNRQFNP